MSFPTEPVNSESPIHPLTLRELEDLQEVNCDKPPMWVGHGEVRYDDAVLKNPTFMEWREAMTPKYTRQYLMTNFLQYAWKTNKTYKDFPYEWTKPVKNPKPEYKSEITMKMLDKDAPDYHYLAVFYLYEIPIYAFHINPEKRVGKTAKVGKTEAPKTKSVVALKKDNEKMKAELEELRAFKACFPKENPDDLYEDAKTALSDDASQWLEEADEEIQAKYRGIWDGMEHITPKMKRVMGWAKVVEAEVKRALKAMKA